MAKRIVCIIFLIVFGTQSVRADHNHSLAIAYCEWIEVNASNVTAALRGNEALVSEWGDGKVPLQTVKDYRRAVRESEWVSNGAKYKTKASYLGATAEVVDLKLPNGKAVHPSLLDLDRKSKLKMYSILDLQRKLAIVANSVYTFMISARDPEDPRWRFVSPLLDPPPQPDITLPDMSLFGPQVWRLNDESELNGEIVGSRKTKEQNNQYVLKCIDGSEHEVKESDLLASFQKEAARKWQLKIVNNPMVKRHDAWLTALKTSQTSVDVARENAKWMLTDEYKYSRIALAETKRWIESQPLGSRGKYQLAILRLLQTGDLYRSKDSDALRNYLNDPSKDILAGISRKEFQTEGL